ncbi:hypothetical protein QBE55_01320 [Eubacteriales bacterium mix99]
MSIIEEVYYNNLVYAIENGEDSQSAHAEQLQDKCLKNLKAVLNDSEKELFERYCDAQESVEEFTHYHIFAYALKLGILLMAEAFAGRKDITGERNHPETSILHKLFGGGLNPAENIVPKDPRYRNVFQVIDEKESHLTEKLPPEEQKQLENLTILYLEASYLDSSACFSHGFSLGASITSEAFADADKLMHKDY